MVGLAILGSIILYPGGVLDYTDSLFFAAGAATQSGLNTWVHNKMHVLACGMLTRSRIDVNKLHLYQQVSLKPL